MHSKSKAFKRFKARLRFNNERVKRRGWLSPDLFLERPQYDEHTGKPTGLTVRVDEQTGAVTIFRKEKRRRSFTNGNGARHKGRDKRRTYGVPDGGVRWANGKPHAQKHRADAMDHRHHGKNA